MTVKDQIVFQWVFSVWPTRMSRLYRPAPQSEKTDQCHENRYIACCFSRLMFQLPGRGAIPSEIKKSFFPTFQQSTKLCSKHIKKWTSSEKKNKTVVTSGCPKTFFSIRNKALKLPFGVFGLLFWTLPLHAGLLLLLLAALHLDCSFPWSY